MFATPESYDPPYDGPTLLAAQGAAIRPTAMCTARISIDGFLHYVQFAVLSSCAQQVILGWDFLSMASVSIYCRQRVLHMTDATYPLHADDAPLHFLAAENTALPPRHQRIVTITSDVIDRGDVLVLLCTLSRKRDSLCIRVGSV